MVTYSVADPLGAEPLTIMDVFATENVKSGTGAAVMVTVTGAVVETAGYTLSPP
jgi:hypothetical protein